MSARGYDPAIGRFIQIDPLGELIQQIDKSPYNFAWNNPVFFTDPSGFCPECPDGVDGDTYDSTGGGSYIHQDGEWVRQDGTLDEIVIVAPGSGENQIDASDTPKVSTAGIAIPIGAVAAGEAATVSVAVPSAAAVTAIALPAIAGVAVVGTVMYLDARGPTPPLYMPESGPVSTLRRYQPRPTILPRISPPSPPNIISAEDALAVSAYIVLMSKGGRGNIWPDDYPFPDLSNIDWTTGDSQFATEVTGPNPPKGKGPGSPWNKIKKWFRDKKAQINKKKK